MPIPPLLKKIIKFINEYTIFGIIEFLAGYVVIKFEIFSKINWPTMTGTPAIIIGWAFIFCGIFSFYLGIQKGLKNLKN